MSDFTLSTTITGDTTALRRELQSAASSVRLFGSDVEKASSTSSTAMGAKVPSDFRKASAAAEKFGTETRQSIREAEKATEDLANKGGRNMSAFGTMLGKFGAATTIGALAVQIGKTGVGFHDFISKNELAFETMLGSAEAAKSYMADILAFAKQTPFAFPELTSSAQKMIAFGVDSSKVIGILQTLGDAAVGAGGGIQELEGLSTVIGQIQAKGRLQNEEILQLAERGLPALRVLANQANMTTAEYQKEVSKGAVDADTAITSLIDGLRDGTEGVNGMTSAYGGLMEKMKASGNFSSTWDSVKSTFRNMSAAITESLLPVIIELMGGLISLMGYISTVTGLFNDLPEPLKTAAIAFAALSIASKAFGKGLKTNVVTGVGEFITQMRVMYQEQVKAQGGLVSYTTRATASANGLSVATDRLGRVTATAGQRAAAGLGMMSTGARAAGGALLGVFGGPVGLAVTGGIALITGAMSAQAGANAAAQSRLQEYKNTLDATTGSVTKATEEWARVRMLDSSNSSGIIGTGTDSLVADAERWGLALSDVEDAIAGDLAKAEELKSRLGEVYDARRGDSFKELGGITEFYFGGDQSAYDRLKSALDESIGRQKTLAKEQKESSTLQNEADAVEKKRPTTILEIADAYREAHNEYAKFNEETQKAVDKFAQGFGDAFSSGFSTISGFKAVVVTSEQYASAQEKVASANQKVTEAQRAQSRLGDLRTTSKQREDAAKAVTEAVNGQSKAYKELNELAAKDRPVGTQMKEYYQNTLRDAENFSKDIAKLIEKGLDPALVEDLVKKGPEAAAGEMKAFLSVNGESLIEMANQTEETLQELNVRVVENARLAAIAMNSDLASVAADLPLAMKIAATQGDHESMTNDEIAKLLGVSSDDVMRVAAAFGQDWVRTVQEDEALKSPWKTQFMLEPDWQVDEEKKPANYLKKSADGSTINPLILIDPVYGVVTSPADYLNGQGPLASNSNPFAVGNYWTGGMLPGYTPGQDVHRFYSPTGGVLNLSGGEPIMRPEFGAAVGRQWVDRMNSLARSGGITAVRNALMPPMGTQSFNTGGIFNSGPSVVEVPVTSRVEHHGTVNVERVVANDPLEFERAMKAARKNRNTFG